MKIKEFINSALIENKMTKRQVRIKLDYKYDTDVRNIFTATDGAHFQNVLEVIDCLGYELVARKKSDPRFQNPADGYVVIDYEMDHNRFKRIQKRMEEQRNNTFK